MYKKNACHKGKRSETGFERLLFNFLSKVGYSHPASGVVPAVTLFAENGPPDRFLCAQTPSWTRTNDQIGQKQRPPCSLGALRIAPCFFLRKARLLPPLAAAGLAPVYSRAAVPTQGYCPVLKLHNKKQEHPSSMDTPIFGSPSWTRTNDPAVNSRMLYQLSY